ncbi:hypothetical protein G195_007413, partial [Phytophthora kernoviae 00238/432]
HGHGHGHGSVGVGMGVNTGGYGGLRGGAGLNAGVGLKAGAGLSGDGYGKLSGGGAGTGLNAVVPALRNQCNNNKL